MTGQHIAHYEILNKLGEGGMGVVYRARDTKLGRDVAIKVLSQEFSLDRARIERFEREARVLASLNHPNIAAIHGIEEAGGRKALVLELAEGETLAERIERGALPVDEALDIARQIAEALEAAHEKGIIHRDLKPGNIMVSSAGQVKVLDFGLAKALEAEGAAADPEHSPTVTMGATRAGVILGTAGYMSPEQARAKPVDRRADVWAFGVVLYEMLTGARAFTGETTTDVLASIVKEEPAWTRLPADTPHSVRRLIRRCLAKEPQRRLRAIGDAGLDLEEASNGEEPVAPVAPGRQRLTWVVAAVAVLLAVASFAVQWFGGSGTESQQVIRFDLELPYLHPIGPDFALSPDGRGLVYIGQEEGNPAQLYYRAMVSTRIHPLPGTERPNHPFFSWDGQSVAFHSEGELRRVSVGGGPITTICEADEALGGSWGPDDEIVFGTTSNGLQRVSARGGTPIPLTEADAERGEFAHRWPRHLPSGDSVVFVIWTPSGSIDDARIGHLRLSDGEWTTLLEGGIGSNYSPSGHLLFLRSRSLMAAPFDPDSGTIRGQPFSLQERVFENLLGMSFLSVSNNGLLAYLDAGTAAQTNMLVYRVSRDGTRQPLFKNPASYCQPRFSPDGKRLVLTSLAETEGDIWVVDLERNVRNSLGVKRATWPVWSPDGERIAFTRMAKGQWNIWWMASDGSGSVEQLTFSENVRQIPDSFSPNWEVAFEEGPIGHRDIRVLPVKGDREAYTFLGTEANERGAKFSPDGHWIAFTSDRSGQDEVYVMAFPEKGSLIPISSDGGKEAVWSRDGKELFYRNGDRLMAVRIQTRPEFRATAPRLLFEGSYSHGYLDWSINYDVSPDGSYFLMTVDGEHGALHVVTDIGAVLEGAGK